MVKRAVVFSLFICAVLIFSSCSPEGSAAILPDAEEVQSIDITKDGQTVEIKEQEWIANLLEKIKETGLEKKDSEEEIPESDDYTTIEFIFSDGDASKVYLYQYKDIWYLEVPYQGIYDIDDSVIQMIQDAH